VSVVRLHSTRLRTLSASLVGGPPAVVGPPTVVGPASGRGHRRVLAKSVLGAQVPHLYITDTQVSTLYTYKNDIYKNN
jgi:hypothetical protein